MLWVATDTSGNKANATQIIDVVHTTPPKLSVPSNITFEATSLDNNIVPIGNATATDIQPVTITNNASKTFPLGKTTILWTAKDTSGNTSNATQIVNVRNTTPPRLVVPVSVTFTATSLDNNTVPLGTPTVVRMADEDKVVEVFPFNDVEDVGDVRVKIDVAVIQV